MKVESVDLNPFLFEKNAFKTGTSFNMNNLEDDPKSTKIKVIARFRPINSVEEVI